MAWQNMVTVAHELAGSAQHLERDAFFQRVVQFLDAGGHLALRAAIDDGHMTAEPPGGARRVHGGVAAADDDDLLAGDLAAAASRGPRIRACMRLTRVRNSLADITPNRCSPGTFMKRGRPAPVPTKILQNPASLQVLDGGGLADDEILHELAAQQP